jgi:sacsin
MSGSGGGPVYDFEANSTDAAMKKQMAAYHTVIKYLDRRLDGTVIRIPLRTQAHATQSEISKCCTTVSEMIEVLQSFASEFGDSGLLFMKNVEKLQIEFAGISIGIEMIDKEKSRL